jgi:hypothetical protein
MLALRPPTSSSFSPTPGDEEKDDMLTVNGDITQRC